MNCRNTASRRNALLDKSGIPLCPHGGRGCYALFPAAPSLGLCQSFFPYLNRLSQSPTQLNDITLSGIPFGSARNCPGHSSLSFLSSSPLQIRVHSPMMMISSSLCRMFSRSVRYGSSILLNPFTVSSVCMSSVLLYLT